MNAITAEQLAEILRLHAMWVGGNPAGRQADLSKADLSWANLSKADLSWANLSKANLSKADLSKADLSKANLSKADLSWANLSKANLSKANLSKANLSKANLSEANLSKANLSEANLSKANLSKATGIRSPIVACIDAAILAAINRAGCRLAMGDWHTCETTHCRAGWAIHLAGEAGYALEDRIGPNAAGALIYAASRPDLPVPNFYATSEQALEDLRRCAGATGDTTPAIA